MVSTSSFGYGELYSTWMSRTHHIRIDAKFWVDRGAFSGRGHDILLVTMHGVSGSDGDDETDMWWCAYVDWLIEVLNFGCVCSWIGICKEVCRSCWSCARTISGITVA